MPPTLVRNMNFHTNTTQNYFILNNIINQKHLNTALQHFRNRPCDLGIITINLYFVATNVSYIKINDLLASNPDEVFTRRNICLAKELIGQKTS